MCMALEPHGTAAGVRDFVTIPLCALDRPCLSPLSLVQAAGAGSWGRAGVIRGLQVRQSS